MTAILTQRCDPFGFEREKFGQRLAGGLYGQASAGRYIWHCEEPAIGRYRFRCTGGEYGFRRANDGGLIQAYHCDGGHESPEPMILCKLHVRECAEGPPKPGWSKDKKNSWGQIGGTKANEMCPPCSSPPRVRELMYRADFLQAQLSQMVIIGLLSRAAAIESELDQVRAALNEMHERGIAHKCPLRLVEVS